MIAPCPDELAWIAKLAERFGVELSPHASLVFEEVSATLLRRHLLRRRSASTRRCPTPAAAPPAVAEARRRSRSPHGKGLRLADLPAALLGPGGRAHARARVPAAATARSSSRRADARARKIADGDDGDASARTARRATLRARIARDLPAGSVRMPRARRRGPPRLVEVTQVTHPHEPWWVAIIEVADRDQPRDGRVRLHDLARAQGARPHAAALRPEPRRPVRAPAADRRPDQARPQGGVLPGLGARAALHPRADPLVLHGAARVRGDPVGAGLDGRRLLHRRARSRTSRSR